MDKFSRKADPLGVVYVVSALVWCMGALLVVAALFLPSNWRDRSDPERLYIPGAIAAEIAAGRAIEIEPTGVREMGPGRYRAVLEAYNWAFEPAEIRVPVGSEVTFHIRSTQDYHGFAIAGTGIILGLSPNDPQEATHTFEEAGEYLFVCAEYCGGGHATMLGMVFVE